MKDNSNLILAAVLGIALIIAAVILSQGIRQFRMDERYINVKGLSEREVKADFAVWNIRTRIPANEIATGTASIEESKAKILQFLQKNGFTNEEIIVKDLIVTDKMARDYDAYQSYTFRYIIDRTVQVRTADVDKVQRASRLTDDLTNAGVFISNANEFGSPIQYIFTKLNDIKPEMLAQATRKAQEAAEQFANESNTKLGKLRTANQGLFTIVDRDASMTGQGQEFYGSSTTDIMKQVRVVVSCQYLIR